MLLHALDDQTIIAQCTPTGSGAIALLRLSGTQALSIADAFVQLPADKKIAQVPSHTVHYGTISNTQGVLIDQVLCIVMHGPKTFTGQHTVEMTCHNNQFIIEAIIEQAIIHGARLAQPGEFTKRAFLHNKIDLVQAEAINELIHANTQFALKKSLAQLEGSLSHWIYSLEKELLRALAWCEASFEFLDEETEFGTAIHKQLDTILANIAKIKVTFDQQQQIRQGIRIALIGSVNAGKSSLFNALLGHNRSIVTNLAGTTRDVIEAGIYRNSNYWTLIDTAGLRQATDVIEQEGIKRSFDEAQKADIILLVFDGSRMLFEQEQAVYTRLLTEYAHKIILIHNKADLPAAYNKQLDTTDALLVSTVTHNQALSMLQDRIEQKISTLFNAVESPFLLNKRQYTLLLALEQKLQATQELLKSSNIPYELVSYHLKDALEHISDLTGKSVSEAGMDTVFKEFCVGK